ncbi:ribosomal RNA large subunit methyltransferase J [Lentinula guzmanii]|uniref:rRNA methyltransferase 2, mitochondrial n=1 Tax=Lentinula guzmanii TaxID=2804957 RepID=A0AA38J237_9AGAR|nr:ribosomal RNA large subunit methyltransferase J [Lentinula guzmanii]
MPLKLPFTPSFPSFSAKTKKSSTEWLRRQSQDPFVKQRSLGADITSTKTSSILGPSISSPLTFRSRSAFKLIEIHEKYDEFLLKPDVRVVVDLGAAPGAGARLSYKSTSLPPKPLDSYDPLNIDAELGLFSLSASHPRPVDRLSMDPIPGVYTLKADFLHPQTEDMIRALIDDFSHNSQKLTLATPDTPKVDVILSDIAPNITGVPTVDSEANFQVAQAALQFAYKYLRTGDEIGRVRGGVLLLKHFAHPQMDQFRREVLERYFRDVIYTKPRASRQESKEGYFLCRGFWPKEYR